MSRLLARIMLVIFMIPAAALVYTVGIVATERWYRYGWRDGSQMVAAGISCWIFVAVFWTLLWRKSINWNARRSWQTIVAIPVAVIIGMLVMFACDMTIDKSPFGVWVGTVVAPLSWLIGTVFIWRETVAERGARLKDARVGTLYCPTCGYNLTGLASLRCPECGSQFTLEELLAKQPSMLAAEIEKAA